MKHGHYFVSLSGATDSDVRDTAGGKSGTAPGKTEEILPFLWKREKTGALW